MGKVVIKTPDGKYVGGGRKTQLVETLSRAYVYEDGPDTDEQIAWVNRTYRCGWRKVDVEQEYDKQLATAGG